ncbi:hydroxymethylpyrimidine/phosphomethylpyrimidine kinase [Fontimonas thermophila]|uniref:hydroxymethylpyrimidine kinase n=1 Tax=Fontimonas thermophila TaxID=1076937 RepID=A0A1I2JZ74_9GAMM|nr:hydroxymethylpyrimidine/phosphomethylpyrimidine kinase [Fontimonas thermophila]SFF59328.1 hydroxymethylpyrimidine/phosphomethylpyrimidine kinase [Fontimonas thermophila]
MTQTSIPQVLCISGHDPSGGAGLQADIEAIAAQGAHALGVITALTVQDSRDARRVQPIAPALIGEQLAHLLADCRIDAIKLGLLGDADQVPHILRAIERARVPVVVDPVLRAGGGGALASAATARALLEQLLPVATVATPNAAEARRLAAEAADLDTAAQQLLARGCAHLLITGGDEDTAEVENRWYQPHQPPYIFRWPRLPGGFHGAGCTLAAALAARLAFGEHIAVALDTAQRYVQGCLERALRIGGGRPIPNRVARTAQR